VSPWRAWLLALRVRTLPAAVVPVVVGTATAARAGLARPGVALVALGAALLLQIGANLVNDWGDSRRGADGPDRLGPVRVTQAGLLPPGRVVAAAAAAFAAATVLGLVLVARAGWPVVSIGAAAIVAAVAYTAGPFPLAYHGLGEPFVFLFFGPVAVCGAELVQAGHASLLGLFASVPVGCLATAILVVNNVRDVDGDRRAAKRTLAVRFGRRAGRALYAAALAAAFATPVALAAALAGPATLLPWLSAPLARAPLRAVLERTDGPALNAALVATARLHLVFGLLLAGGLAW
jgi:1,4-dihydroxy-2-naphthoate octaprenyltransferase